MVLEKVEDLSLKSDQWLKVGSTEWSDYAVPGSQMASEHFVLQTNLHGCFIHDLNTENGTHVNGKRITQCQLNHGDKIQAGDVAFMVQIRQTHMTDQTAPPPLPATIPAPHSSMMAYEPSVYEVLEAPSEHPTYENLPDGPDALEIASRIVAKVPMQLLVHFDGNYPNNFDVEKTIVPEIKNRHWQRFHPNLLFSENADMCQQRLAEFWPSGKAVVIFSGMNQAKLLQHLRKHHASYSDPTILKEQLWSCPKGFVEQLLEEIYAVMLPGADEKQWRLMCNPKLASEPQQIGLPRLPAMAY